MYLTEQLQQKWHPVLDHPDLPKITDPHRRAVTTVILENQEKYLKEAAPASNTAGVQNWDPILISLVRRALPNLIAYDVCGVQPMSGPTGLIFAMRARYTSQTGAEALFNEADTDFSGTGGPHAGDNPFDAAYATGTGMSTAAGEAKGDASTNAFAEMAMSIEKVSVTAQTRALKAEYTMELAQDLKAVHGLDAETELANILSTEVLAEINREIIRTIYKTARPGAQLGAAVAGTFNLDADADGRWSLEKFKGLYLAIERDANFIAKDTRRGKGNLLLCSSDVASALALTGQLDYAPALAQNANLAVDDTANTFAGVLNGRYRVYVDPYWTTTTNDQFYVVGYKGASPYDAGLFYCPYVPLQMVRAVGQDSFQPKIGFKTRYGLVQNPFAAYTGGLNRYYRIVKVTGL